MTLALALRRTAVVLGLLVAVLAAAGTVLAAARWTATQAPLAVPPVSIESVQAALDQERARSAALEQQLGSLEVASSGLSSALSVAQDQLAADAATATDLRASLEAAQAKLTKLEAALKAAARQRATVVVASSTAGGTGTSGGGSGEREQEDEHDDD